jgi:DNA-binding response OmpR family regulator
MIPLISGIRNVLVVDEDPAIVAKLEHSLKTDGITFDIAESNAAGIKMMSSGKYELAIINFESPHDVALLKLALSKGVQVVIMVTNATTPTYLMAARRLGASACIIKRYLSVTEPSEVSGVTINLPVIGQWAYRI